MNGETGGYSSFPLVNYLPVAPVHEATEMLPFTPMSPPGPSFRRRANSTRSPSITYAFVHCGSSGAEVATCVATPLINVANGSISLPGQNPTHSS